MNALRIYLVLALLLFLSTIQAQSNTVRVTKSTSLKKEATSDSKTITRLSDKDELVYLDDCGRYYCKVEWNGKIGWVKKHLLEFDSQPIKQEQPQTQGNETDESPKKSAQDNEVPTQKLEGEEVVQIDNPSGKGSSFLYSFVLLSVLIVAGLIFLCFKLFQKNKYLHKAVNQLQLKYQGIIDIDSEIERRRNNYAQEEDETRVKLKELRMSQEELKSKYRRAREVYKKLVHESNLLKDDLEVAEYGVYEPQFDYETSAIYKLKIKENRNKQKALIGQDRAVLGGEGWTVNNSIVKGRTMVKKQKKLMLRAFNGECDNFIKGVKWNNETRIEERILKSSEMITRMGETQGLRMSQEYVKLKLLELRLTHEAELKKYEEKEIQREIREKIRDEEKAKREYEKAQKEAAKDEKLLREGMEKMKREMQKANAAERAVYEKRLLEMQEKLKIAEEKSQRAISMAQQTKAGHVYVISNIGSFGENIYKIGMTRRLEPLDRVYELGDASVPFRFDVHAMIYSDNAPELENKLHKQFDKFRLNHVNRRREYFNVSLQEIAKIVRENHGEIEFIIEPEAKEYRESLVIKERFFQKDKQVLNEPKVSFPSELFN